ENLYFSHPFWVWLAVGAILLAIELPTGTGWLLWPSACAAVMAVLTLGGLRFGWGGEVALYAGLTIVTTLASRRFSPKRGAQGPDINDRTSQLLGKTGLAVGAFSGGAGRVLVDGAEWDAELDAGEAPAAGGKVEVVRVLGGAKLAVRPV
ncbi:MAG: NfeD family protein, partial [Caulobacteraceae bacterium]|nr:NfeD family protein [Caulobacteraceae bacterium]